MKTEILDKLKGLDSELKNLRKEINSLDVLFVGRKTLMAKAEELSRSWFDQIESHLRNFGIPGNIADDYRVKFDKLMRLATSNNRKTSYLSALNEILLRFRHDLIIPVQQFSIQPTSLAGSLESLLKGLISTQERDYLDEAVRCAQVSLKASVILGWCATIDYIHRKVESLGFHEFNETSEKMKSAAIGRFRKFNKSFSVNSINELREVFDNDILWVLEGMKLIDANQHKRLSNCFDLRNQCAHPGEAPVTEPNVLSFFSDICEIVLKNHLFALPKK